MLTIQEFGKGFDVTNLCNTRRFHEAFPNRETVSLKLSWSPYNVSKTPARALYQQEAIQQEWGVRALERQFSTLYYERLLSSHDRAAVQKESERHLEGDLERGLIDNSLQAFLLELGKGFAFVARQQLLTTEKTKTS